MPSSVFRIVLTGGPGGGKSTFVQSHASLRLPILVTTVGESATALKSIVTEQGHKHRSSDIEFQRAVLRHQFDAENLVLAKASKKLKPSVVIFDRGLFDSVGFVPFMTYEALLREISLTPQSVLSRYDAIIFFRSIVPFKNSAIERASESSVAQFTKHVLDVERALLKQLLAVSNLHICQACDDVHEKFVQAERLIQILVESWLSDRRKPV